MRLEDLKRAEEEGKKSSSWSGGVVPGYRQMVGPVLPYPANPAHCPNAPCQHVRPLSETGRVQSGKSTRERGRHRRRDCSGCCKPQQPLPDI